jgi:hypothetical protein
MCECKQKNEQRLQEALPEQLPAGAMNIEARLQGYALMFGDGEMAYRQVMPFEITYQMANRDGVLKDKKKVMSLTANFCMFCGEKYLKDEPQEAA